MTQNKRLTRLAVIMLEIICVLILIPIVPVLAQSSSGNYSVEEYFFGTGGELDASSGNYVAKQAAGETAVGLSAGSSYKTQAGFNTTYHPFLEASVTNANIDLGVLSTSSVSTATSTFSVRAYLAHGYVVLTASDPPKNATHSLSPLTGGGASSPGTEQFGINVVDNSSPNIGADPSQVPDSSFSFGAAATGYGTANNFRYNKNDTIAESTVSSGQTTYTISYIFNISSLTPGGRYDFTHDLVVVATY